ncbi:hypothetical protein MKW98_029216 [Papaver atlanticum]|uniref:S-adenosylmethionine-dependent methyltransferase n=1 Tax=Papaver atlanticum TaxID=357466 RepID=A0AAD4T2F4_9MAGN|nr:hypothetical protein MKW98_029216 [Papaver atlanticum]
MDAKSETKSFPMKGGDDESSYVNNSSLQRKSVDLSKEIIEEAISKNLSIENPKTFWIADLGCSVGSNTLVAVRNIVEAADHKYKSQPEFQVFFNDHASNDFNTLFLSLPSERRYFAAGVPGSFYTRLFPRSSLHIVYSSTALHWLSQVPKEVVDINSSAWNKGRIHYTDAPNEVLQAYSAQYVTDMEAFLLARAHEVVCGGLMFLVIPGVIDGTRDSQTDGGFFDVLGSCLAKMAKMGMVEEAKVDSFNLPVYHTSPKEVIESVEKNGYFTIERLEKMYSTGISIDHIQIFSDHLRAGLEVIIKQHFGFSKSDLDILFDMYTKRLVDSFPTLAKAAEKSLHMFFVLKRKNITIAH